MWQKPDDDDVIEVNGLKFRNQPTSAPNNTVPSSRPSYPSLQGTMPREVARKRCREFIEKLERGQLVEKVSQAPDEEIEDIFLRGDDDEPFF